ncbi:nuclear transport factor 2 family protein [Mycobacterium simiae]|nr:nuclear transport factor 2 family protein [Mycobacterium simiae]
MNTAEWRRLSDDCLDGWNRHDVDDVVAWYDEPFVYRDPNTRGDIQRHDALRDYLTKLFERWEMTWSTCEVFPFDGSDGAAVTWNATFRLRTGPGRVDIRGIDILVLRDGKIARDDIFFDRSLLTALATTSAA